MFEAPEGGPIRKSNFLRREFFPLLKVAGLPHVSFHSLRHVFASLLFAHGEHPRVVQEMLGHASSRMTLDIYTHVLPAHLDRAAHVIGTVLTTKADNSEGTFEGTGHILPSALDASSALKALPGNALRKLGRSRVRTYDPSRVKRVLYH